MSGTIIVGGYGSGISKAVAEKFGSSGYSVALVARNSERLTAGVKELESKGIKAAAFPADLSAADSIKNMITNVRAKLGPISILQWTAYAGDAGNILEADVATIHRVLDVAVTGLVIAVQGALPDLKAEKGSVLVTNGGLGYFDPQIDATAVQWNAMGLAIANAAKHKLVGLLEAKLKADGVYVGEVVVLGAVKGTAFDSGNATIEARTVAEKFWELNKHRTQTSVNVQ